MLLENDFDLRFNSGAYHLPKKITDKFIKKIKVISDFTDTYKADFLWYIIFTDVEIIYEISYQDTLSIYKT